MNRLAAALLLTGAASATAACPGARFTDPTERYPHCVLGDCIEYGGLSWTRDDEALTLALPTHRVFEDLAPRCADINQDGAPDLVVVESDANAGAALTVYTIGGGAGARRLTKLAATRPIGTRFRWLAPAGIADFNADGRPDIAYVDRPHLAKTLRFVTLLDDRLVEIASLPGVSNHRIGEPFISGGTRDCGEGPEVILADAAWRRILAISLTGSGPTTTDLGPNQGQAAFKAALACQALPR